MDPRNHVDEESSATGPTQAHLLLRTSPPNGFAEMTSRDDHSIFIDLPLSVSSLLFFLPNHESHAWVGSETRS